MFHRDLSQHQFAMLAAHLTRIEGNTLLTMSKIDDGIALISAESAKLGTDLAAEITALEAVIASNGDTAPRLAALKAIADQLTSSDAAAVAATPAAASPLTVDQTSVSLTSVGASATITVSQPANASATFTATSSDAAIVTVVPGSAPGAFVVTEVAAGVATIKINDNATPPNSATVAVTAA